MIANNAFPRSVERLLSESLNEPNIELDSVTPISGGCIHHAAKLQLKDGRDFFCKSSSGAIDMFAQEALGLAALSNAQVIYVPKVIGIGIIQEDVGCLLLEHISPGHPGQNFWADFGQRFAKLHRTATAESFGWSSDNYIGSSIQKNNAHDDWPAFFAESRLGYQLRLARQNAVGSRALFQYGERLINRIDQILAAPSEPPSLLHGDLWSGNYLVSDGGEPVVIDPAVYYGHREADFAMPLLFGGFATDFFDAYNEQWPLADGWQERAEIYKLYHLLNHLNLFGAGYLDSCIEIAKKFA